MTTLFSGTITNAATVNGSNYNVLRRTGNRGLSMQANFTYGSGGTTVDAKVQTSLDGGATWIDIWHVTQFTTSNSRRAVALPGVTATSSSVDYNATTALTTGQSLDGLLGPMLRVTYTSVGTYAGGTTLQVDVYGDQLQISPTSFE